MTTYAELKLSNNNGTVLKTLTSFFRLDFTRKECEVGELILDIDGAAIEPGWLMVDSILEVWSAIDGFIVLEGNCNWYLRKWEITIAGEEKRLVYRLTYHDGNDLLARRIVFAATASVIGQKYGEADDIMKAIVRESMGALTTADRDISTWVNIEGDTSEAPNVYKVFALENVHDVLKELVDQSFNAGTYLAFDMIRNGAGTNEFITKIGQLGNNHGIGQPTEMVLANYKNNLENPVLTYDYTAVKNAVSAGGQGRIDAREIIPFETDALSMGLSPLNRCEMFTNSHGIDTNNITADARQTLTENRARITFDGIFVDTPLMRFGVEVGFGDIVRVDFAGVSVNAHMNTFSITMENGKRIVNVPLHYEGLI